MTAMQTRPVVFLDTNILHFGRLYLGLAQKNKFPPFGETTDVEIEKHIRSFVRRQRDNCLAGWRLTTFLRDQSNQDANVYYSPITLLEIYSGLLHGRAIENAAQEGITERMWSGISDSEIHGRLSADSYKLVREMCESIEVAYQQAGVTLTPIRKEEDAADVWTLAQIIAGLVYLSAADCIVYASAIVVQAGRLLTIDGHLRTVANYLLNPGGSTDIPYYQDAQDKIKQAFANIIGISKEDVALPDASRLTS